MENSTLYITSSDIAAVVRAVGLDELMDQLIERLEQAFVSFDPDQMVIPTRDGFSYFKPRTGLLEWMPILDCGSQMLMKMVGYHPQNPETNGLPTILSNSTLYDATSGQLLAIIDGTFLTAFRTGAASAVASRFLASETSSVFGMIGCGAQAVTQLHALSRVFQIRKVCFYDVDEGALASFKARCSFSADTIEFANTTLEKIVGESDVLSVATSIDVGAGPVFEDMKTRPHLHINAVGSDFPGKTELPVELLRRSYISPDSRDQAIKEGECQQLPVEQLGLDLSGLLRSDDIDRSQLRTSTTIFDSTGWALEDYVVARLFLDHANRLGVGQQIEAGSSDIDPRSPYEFLNSMVMKT